MASLQHSHFILLSNDMYLNDCAPIIAQKIDAVFCIPNKEAVEKWKKGASLLLQITDDMPQELCGFPLRIWYITSFCVKLPIIYKCLGTKNDIEMLQSILTHGILVTKIFNNQHCRDTISIDIDNLQKNEIVSVNNYTTCLNKTFISRFEWLQNFLLNKPGKYIIHTHINEVNGAEDIIIKLKHIFPNRPLFLINKNTSPCDRLKIFLHFGCVKNAILITTFFISTMHPELSGLIILDPYFDEELIYNYWTSNKCIYPTYLIATMYTQEQNYRHLTVTSINKMKYYMSILINGFKSDSNEIMFENKTLLNSDLQQMFSTPLTNIIID